MSSHNSSLHIIKTQNIKYHSTQSTKYNLLHLLLQVPYHIVLQLAHLLQLDQPRVLIVNLVNQVQNLLRVLLLLFHIHELTLLILQRQPHPRTLHLAARHIVVREPRYLRVVLKLVLNFRLLFRPFEFHQKPI